MKIGINGFGRIGRLVLRILWERKDIEITHINEISGNSLLHLFWFLLLGLLVLNYLPILPTASIDFFRISPFKGTKPKAGAFDWYSSLSNL